MDSIIWYLWNSVHICLYVEAEGAFWKEFLQRINSRYLRVVGFVLIIFFLCVFALFELFYIEHIATKVIEAFPKENKKKTKLKGGREKWKKLRCRTRVLLLCVGWFVPCEIFVWCEDPHMLEAGESLWLCLRGHIHKERSSCWLFGKRRNRSRGRETSVWQWAKVGQI